MAAAGVKSGLGQGDCDAASECLPGLHCGTDTAAGLHYLAYAAADTCIGQPGMAGNENSLSLYVQIKPFTVL